MEPLTVVASTSASSCPGSSAVTEPLMVPADTPPVSPNASIRTRTSPLIASAFTGPFAVTTSTSPLIVKTTSGPRVPAPPPLFRIEPGPVGPCRPGRATRAAVVASELAPQVAQCHWELVHHPVAHSARDVVHEKTDREHGAEQRRPANNLLAPGVPKRAHGPSLQRIGSILAGPTAVGEMGVPAGDGPGRGRGPPETSGNGAEPGRVCLATPHGRPAQDFTLGCRGPRATAAGLNRNGIEYAAVPHAIERIGGGDHGGWLGRRLTTRSQRGHGDLSRVAIAGGEKDAEQQRVNAH